MNEPSSISALRWLAIVLAPFLITGGYLWISRGPLQWFSTSSDYLALGIAIMIFAVSVLTLPIERKKKILIAACSTPVVAVVLVGFTFVFIAAVFGDGL